MKKTKEEELAKEEVKTPEPEQYIWHDKWGEVHVSNVPKSRDNPEEFS